MNLDAEELAESSQDFSLLKCSAFRISATSQAAESARELWVRCIVLGSFTGSKSGFHKVHLWMDWHSIPPCF